MLYLKLVHDYATSIIPGGLWDEAKDKELAFQKLKRSAAYLHSIQEGTMLAIEYSADDAETAAQRKVHIVALRRKRQNAAAKKASLLKAGIQPGILVGSQIFMDVSDSVRASAHTLAVMRSCDAVRDRNSAECFLFVIWQILLLKCYGQRV